MRVHDEIRLSRAVSAFLGKQRERLLSDRKVYWKRESDLLIKVIEPILFGIAWTEAVEEHNRLMRTKRDPGLFDRVVSWAKSYTYELVAGITKTTREKLAAAIARFAEEPQTMGTLRQSVAHIFSPERANLIAVTEVTRAYTGGGEAAADELRDAGFEIIERWHTKNDSLVCSDCRAKNGDDITMFGSQRPPLHPGCRCRVTREVA